MTWPSHDLIPQQTSRHQNISLQSTKHHHHGTAEGSFTAKKWFGHRAGRSPCPHSIGKFFLCYIVLFLLETSAPGLSGHYWYTYIQTQYIYAKYVYIYIIHTYKHNIYIYAKYVYIYTYYTYICKKKIYIYMYIYIRTFVLNFRAENWGLYNACSTTLLYYLQHTFLGVGGW